MIGKSRDCQPQRSILLRRRELLRAPQAPVREPGQNAYQAGSAVDPEGTNCGTVTLKNMINGDLNL